MTNNFYYFFKEKSLKMLLFGFSSGLPILLVFSTLSVWLSKAGIERSTITLFSWAGFAYAFKYLWSPIIDKFSLPIFKKFGHRRSWLLLVQILIILSLLLTSFSDPQKNLYATAIFIVLLAFFSASQDIIIDAFRIESVSQSKQGYLSSMYIAGYRIGMLVSGAGSLWLAAYFGSENYDQIVWQKVYCIMALFMAVGIFANLTSSEPKVKKNIFKKTNNHLIFFLSILFAVIIFIYLYSNISFSIEDNNFLVFILTCLKLFFCFLVSGIFLVLMTKLKIIEKKMVAESYIAPITNFIKKYGKFALIILMLISLIQNC